jgi:hypothetical protein
MTSRMPLGDDDTVAGSLPSLGGGATDVAEVIAGRYQLVRWLGGGGMGRVYEVLDTELGERVALKVLRGGLSEEAIARFRREVRLTRKIQHRNVARMFDIGEYNGDKFLTMELVDGEPLTRELGAPLRARIAESGSPSTSSIVRNFSPLCSPISNMRATLRCWMRLVSFTSRRNRSSASSDRPALSTLSATFSSSSVSSAS